MLGIKSGVQIIDITAPANPTAVSVAIHSVEYPYLIHPESIDTITVDSSQGNVCLGDIYWCSD